MRVALDAAAGTLFEAGVTPEDVRIVTDTRTLEPGDTFLALRGRTLTDTTIRARPLPAVRRWS